MSIPLVDADIIAREVLYLYPQIIENIRVEFGQEFIDSQGNLRRKELGNFIFKDEVRRKKLESIIMPFIIQEIFKQIDEYKKGGAKICALDAPTLIENNIDKSMDKNILVWVDRETQLKRVILRDKVTIEEAEYRLASQISLDKKKEMVDYVIDNSFSIEYTKDQLLMILSKLEIEVLNEV